MSVPDITSVRLTDGFYRVKAVDPSDRRRFVEATMRGEERAIEYVKQRLAEVLEEDRRIETPNPQESD